MPRFENRGRESRALADIQKTLLPLIKKGIFDGCRSGRITSLPIYNHLDAFSIELGQIPLFLKRVQELSQEDYESFLSRLHRLLGLLEGWIDEGVLSNLNDQNPKDSTGVDTQTLQASLLTAGYPKFEALVKRASRAPDSSDLSTLLLLPETVEIAMESEQLITRFNAENFLLFDESVGQMNGNAHSITTSSARVFDEPASRGKLEGIKRSRECLSALRDALAKNISNSDCGPFHYVKLQVRYPESSSESMGEMQHRIFVSSCSDQDRWQETTCKVVFPLPADSTLPKIKKLCSEIQDSLNERITLEISVLQSSIVLNSCAARLINSPPIWPTLSLHTMLRNIDRRFGHYNKVILALNLSHALLRMEYVGVQSEWTSHDIFFLFNGSSYKVAEVYNPCIAYPLVPKHVSKNTKPGRSRKFRLLVAFAKVLLEIALERPIEDSKQSNRVDIVLITMIDRKDVAEELLQGVPKAYCNVIRKCLEANINYDYDVDDDGSEDREALMEAQCMDILLEVVELLEIARKDFQALPNRGNPNYPLELQVSDMSQGHRHCEELDRLHTTQPKTCVLAVAADATNQVRSKSLSQLFDDSHNRPENSKIAEAKSFLSMAENFYTESIHDFCDHPNIRIAVLDTGVDESNLFFRGIQQCRHKRDPPFKGRWSLDGGPPSDTLGHGTNVAALVLRMHCHADIYVAKISHAREEAGTNQIVQAINWAQRQNVHIISMSFGLSEDNYEIRNEISKAEHAGIIIFAAASNCGGNAGRAFPAKMDKVLCVHASDGSGNKSNFSPSPITNCENFSTLGVAVESIYEDGVYLSGTSYSTPVAVGFAASVLRYVQHCPTLKDDYKKRAFTREGMKKILRAMSTPRDGYDYVTSWYNSWDWNNPAEIALNIEAALKH